MTEGRYNELKNIEADIAKGTPPYQAITNNTSGNYNQQAINQKQLQELQADYERRVNDKQDWYNGGYWTDIDSGNNSLSKLGYTPTHQQTKGQDPLLPYMLVGLVVLLIGFIYFIQSIIRKNTSMHIKFLSLSYIKEIWFLFIVPVFGLIAGFVTLPIYGLYILLKALVTFQSAFYAFILWDSKSLSRQAISIFCIAFAFLFCPLFRIRMDKADWQVLDIIFAIAFILINIFVIKPKPNK